MFYKQFQVKWYLEFYTTITESRNPRVNMSYNDLILSVYDSAILFTFGIE